MKKIFTIEINENDKKLKIKKIVNRLDKLFLNFGKELGNEREVYIKFKRVGNTWDSIVSDSNKDSLNKDSNKYLKTKNYLKIIK